MLKGKFITLGVTGGIAAYKAADLASKLTGQGAAVHVIMTRSAGEFVRPLTFEALTGNSVSSDLFVSSPGLKMPHIDLAGQADLVVVAPATANILGKLAHGIADDLLTTTLMASTCPVLICPAMNVHMYANRAVQENIVKLAGYGYHFVEPEVGRVACGHFGKGRLAGTDTIVRAITGLLQSPGDMKGLTVVVTAGGTREPIDPVRYITNRSSGKMGYALAEAVSSRGGRVILISARTALKEPPGVELVPVETAREMHCAVMSHYPKADIVIKAAAVADYRCYREASDKIKKTGEKMTLELVRNPDILAELGAKKRDGVTLVGFAAETSQLEKNATEKLSRKNLDLLVANDVTMPGAGFGSDTNIVKLFFAGGRVEALPEMDKLSVAHKILDAVMVIRNTNK
ncbi:MAG: phosphopantothenoylcysteine decarboxylase [Peptococcaceae bacterium BICA1-7]|nr:MAG: phosphopantothenoylcysteine decarboxylase [Peptococcaceae bacterium BICA1-7]HBV96539.1 bifunctional phosphopantothenoylcysteine decarboxylase/phosphopantothenate--cysteine ligase CoaBC [Desulfotomaculum sp.]